MRERLTIPEARGLGESSTNGEALPKCSVDSVLNMEAENGEYFAGVQKLIESGALEIELILSPPRTGSTLMESSFAQNPSIDRQIHEPFIDQRKTDDTGAYKKIAFASQESESTPENPKSFLIKEMSHWLVLHGEYERLLSLIEKPVVVLIRNPLLSTESRVKKVLETLSLREKGAVHEILLDYHKQKSGGKDWSEVTAIYGEDNRPQYEEEGVEDLHNGRHKTFTSQRHLLDYYALTKGYDSWPDMIQLAFDNRDYRSFEEILGDERIFSMKDGGWEDTQKIVSYMDANAKPSIIVDSSDFRLEPELLVPALCDAWEIPFSPEMITWGTTRKNLATEQTQDHQVIWYDRLKNSSGIEPPNEFCPIPSDFPDAIAEHILNVDLPVYTALRAHPSRIKTNSDVAQVRVEVPVNKRSYKRLRDMELLPNNMSLTQRDEGDEEVLETLTEHGVLHEGATPEPAARSVPSVSLMIQDIDPIYAYLSNPEILSDPGFRSVNHRYLDTIERLAQLTQSQ